MPPMGKVLKRAHNLRRKWGKDRAPGGCAESSGDDDSDIDEEERVVPTIVTSARYHPYEPKRTLRPKAVTKQPPAWQLAAERRAADRNITTEVPRLQRYGFDTVAEAELYLVVYCATHCIGLRRRTSTTTATYNEKVRERAKAKTAAPNPLEAQDSEAPVCETVCHVPGGVGAGVSSDETHQTVGDAGDVTSSESASLSSEEAPQSAVDGGVVAASCNTEENEDEAPEDDVDYYVVYTCVHGNAQWSRGNGQRNRGSSKYTGCTARVSLKLRKDLKTGVWYAQVIQELTTHNHAVTPTVFGTYWRTADLADADLFAAARFAWEMDADPKRIRRHIGHVLNTTYTNRQWENLKARYFGGVEALVGFKRLVGQFGAYDGARCLVIEDADDIMSGVVLQSALQRLLFQRWGDTLVLDWTHNTTNAGFYLGSLMVTTATGKGVSVLDFMCTSQSHEMMEAVFLFFIEHNPGAREKVKSVVIDKDYKEWRTLELCFPTTVVVLCIFHVLKWFKFVVTQTKYEFVTATRVSVVKVLRAMVFAPTGDAFAAQQQLLKGLLDPVSTPGHAAFLDYMETYWYNCVDKWSYSGRGFIFTATNTTTNRLESYWNQFKRVLGKKLRVDHCLRAIFAHTASVLRRELGVYTDYEAMKPVNEYADPFLQPVLMELSKYAGGHVQKQWARYEATKRKMSEVVVQRDGAKHVIRVSTSQDVDFAVDTDQWTCSCHFYQGSALPCRHLFFIARDVLAMARYPLVSISRRWRMDATSSLVESVSQAIVQLDALRESDPTAACGRRGGVDDDDDPTFKFPKLQTVHHVKLPVGARSSGRVQNDMSKRRLVDGVLEPVRQLLMAQGTVNFHASLLELGALVRQFTDKVASIASTTTQPEVVAYAATADAEPSAMPTLSAASDNSGVLEGGEQLRADDSSDATGSRLPPTPAFHGCPSRFDETPEERADWEAFAAAYADDDDEEFIEEDEVSCTKPVSDELRSGASVIDRFECLDMNVYSEISTTSIFENHPPFGFLSHPEALPGTQALEVRYPARPVAYSPLQLPAELAIPVGEASSFDSGVGVSMVSQTIRYAITSNATRCAQLEALLDAEDDVAVDDDAVDDAGLVAAHETPRAFAGIMVSDHGAERASASEDQRYVHVASSVKEAVCEGVDTERGKEKKPQGKQQKAVLSKASRLLVVDAESPARNTRSAKGSQRSLVSTSSANDNPIIASIKLPSVIRKSSSQMSKQQTSVTGKSAAIVQTHTCPVEIAQFVRALRYMVLPDALGLHEEYPRLLSEPSLQTKRATAKLAKYLPMGVYRLNYVIPSELVTKLSTACEQKRKEDGDSDVVHADIPVSEGFFRPQYIACIGTLRDFTADSIHEMVEFYGMQGKLQQYVEDAAWLLGSWMPPSTAQPVAMLQPEAEEVEGLKGSLGTEKMRAAVRQSLMSLSLASRLLVPSVTSATRVGQARIEINVDEMLGRLSYKKELNDSVLNFSLQLLASRYPSVVVVDSLNVGKPINPPIIRLDAVSVVVFPVHNGGNHWGLIVAMITGGRPSTVAMYDPLIGEACQKYLEKQWHAWCWPFFEAWYERDTINSSPCVDLSEDEPKRDVPRLKPAARIFAASPSQNDGSSCGLFCILQAHAYMSNDFSLQDVDKFTSGYPVKLARLRLMWLILSRASVVTDEAERASALRVAAVFRAFVAEEKAKATPTKTKKRPVTSESGRASAKKKTRGSQC